MTPNKFDAFIKEIETLLEYDTIEPSKSPWACGVVMAKQKGDQVRFCCGFRYLNSVTVKESLRAFQNWGMQIFFTTLDLRSAF